MIADVVRAGYASANSRPVVLVMNSVMTLGNVG